MVPRLVSESRMVREGGHPDYAGAITGPGGLIAVVIGRGTALMPRLGVKPLLTAGFLLCAGGLLMTSGIGVHSTYLADIMPGMIVLGFGSGITFPSIGNASLHEVSGQDSSLASG